jgi:hypothetical protein
MGDTSPPAPFWVKGCALFSLSAALVAFPAAAACPPEALARAASKLGYGPAAGGKYCEGLLKEMHSASMTVQVFQFVTVSDSLRGALSIYVGIPASTPGRVADVTALAAYTPYRFDASIATGNMVQLDLGKVIRPANIALESLGFVARIRSMPTMLVPVILSGQPQQKAAGEYMFGVRSNLQVIQVSYSVVDHAGAIMLEESVTHDFAPAEVIPLQIGNLPAGRYGLTVRAKQTREDPAHDAPLYQQFTIP